MFQALWRWLKKIWGSVFRREPIVTEQDLTIDITTVIARMAKKGRVNIYNGTPHGLRNAVSDITSIVYVIEITHPPDKASLLSFNRYVKHLKDVFDRRNK